jgi:hypothetical protein
VTLTICGEAQPRRITTEGTYGKAKPFRTGRGKAARDIHPSIFQIIDKSVLTAVKVTAINRNRISRKQRFYYEREAARQGKIRKVF